MSEDEAAAAELKERFPLMDDPGEAIDFATLGKSEAQLAADAEAAQAATEDEAPKTKAKTTKA